MRLHKYTFQTCYDVWNILPTITIIFDESMYTSHNFAICFHFLCWHMRWVWIEKEQNK